jgi:NAD(P)-dependent dehydrogenase (short-subunit alcohol dehydrogenase family)
VSARVAVVTGAARGIGAAVVGQLAREGWRVVAVDTCADLADLPAADRRPGSEGQPAALAARWPGTVVDVVADVRDAGALAEAVALAEREFGALDAAVAAAPVTAGGQGLRESGEERQELSDIGVRAVAGLARACVPALLRRPGPGPGRFVALASAAGHRGPYRLAGCDAGTHTVAGLVQSLASDLRGTGLPDSGAALHGPADAPDLARHQLVGHLLSPQEVAAAVCWLCHEQSAPLTGTVAHTGGGLTT